jgi:hypothetical protein
LIPFPTKRLWSGSITPVSPDINPLLAAPVISGSGTIEKSLISRVTSELPRKFDPVKLCPKPTWTIIMRKKTKHLSFNLPTCPFPHHQCKVKYKVRKEKITQLPDKIINN